MSNIFNPMENLTIGRCGVWVFVETGGGKEFFLLSVFSGDVIFIINTPGLKIQEISDFGKSGYLVLRFSGLANWGVGGTIKCMRCGLMGG